MALISRTPGLALACLVAAAVPADAQGIILAGPPVVTYSSPIYQSAPIVTYSSPVYAPAPIIATSYYTPAVPYYSYSVPVASRGVVVSSPYAPIAASSTTRYGL